MRPPLTFHTREEWLEARRTLGVGSSEVAALFSRPENPLRGLSSWASPLSLSYLKRGIVPMEDRAPDFVEWGGVVEPSIARWFDERIRPEVEPDTYMNDPGRWTIFLPDDDTSWFASIDRELVLPIGTHVPKAVLEIKNASAWIADEWQEEPPLPYQLQVQQQLAILGLDHGYICASLGGQPPKWARINRDEKIIAILRAKVCEFWETVKADVDPPADAHKATSSALLTRWPEDDGTEIELTEEHEALWTERNIAHETIKDLTLQKDYRTNVLKQAMGEHSIGRLPSGASLALRKDKRGNRNLKEVRG